MPDEKRAGSGSPSMTSQVVGPGVVAADDRAMTFLNEHPTPNERLPSTRGPLSKVRLVLLVDAAASGLVGLTVAVLSEPITRWIGIWSDLPLLVIGALLVCYALLLGLCARAGEPIPTRTAKVTIYSDEAWIVASVAVAMVVSLPGLAVAAVVAQAMVVAGFAFAKHRVTAH